MVGAVKSQAASALYLNKGTVTNLFAPIIDAVAFVNEGDFTVSTLLPFETSNTLVFTNKGIMNGTPGFRLETVSLGTVRTPASVVYNDFGATIGGALPIGGGGIVGGTIIAGLELPQLLINASNIINRGSMQTSLGGLVRLTGNSVDLTRSDTGMIPTITTVGSFTTTNFFPDFGIFDLYWGMNDATGQNPPQLGVGGIVTDNGDGSYLVFTPGHTVTNAGGGVTRGNTIRLPAATGFVLTNAVSETNWVVQMAFVQNADPNLALDVRFFPSSIVTNPYSSITVQLTTPETNVLDATTYIRELYITDFMAAETNFVELTNTVTQTTIRPSVYNVTRLAPIEFLAGGPSNAVFSSDLIAHAGYSNVFVTNIYAAYSFDMQNVSVLPALVPGASLTNIESRVEIFADKLNLNRTRIRSDGLVNITTKDLVGTPLTSIDSPNLMLDLAKPTGTLKIANMVKEFVERTSGQGRCWSAMWTNQWGSLSTNMVPDPADPNLMTNVVTTNVIDIGFHIMVVDSQLFRDQPVTTHSFRAKAERVEIEDVIFTTNAFSVDSEFLRIGTNSAIYLANIGQTLTRVDLPSTFEFENQGFVLLTGGTELGTDRAERYRKIVNGGEIDADYFNIRTETFENSGLLITDSGQAFPPFGPGLSGVFNLDADSARMEGGSLFAGEEINIRVKDLKMLNATIGTPDAITLTITDTVSDGAADGNNAILSRGFHLLQKPTLGDFLGTTFTSAIPKFLAIEHTWAGEDRGATPAGYVNNAAMGRLVLTSDLDGLFVFRGASANSALYVDMLEFEGSAAEDVAFALDIEPSLVIYFADSNLVPEDLDGLLDGRLRWVPDYVGPSSGVAVQSRTVGEVRTMNRGVRESLTKDSDLDGIVNGLDAFPLDADSFRVTIQPLQTSGTASTMTLAWSAAAQTTYVIEYSIDLASGRWFELSTYTNGAKTSQAATSQVRLATDESQRYYRVRVRP